MEKKMIDFFTEGSGDGKLSMKRLGIFISIVLILMMVLNVIIVFDVSAFSGKTFNIDNILKESPMYLTVLEIMVGIFAIGTALITVPQVAQLMGKKVDTPPSNPT